jgi:undecaprenyl-diphosphatase
MNQSVFLWIHHLAGRNGWLDGLGVFLAEWLPYFLVLGFLILVFSQTGWRRKLYWFAEGSMAIIVSRGLVTEFIRLFYHHERPFSFYNFVPLIAESGWSFPSGHAAWFFAMAMTIWYFNRKWGVWFFIFALVNGLARIYVGVHWPLDIVGGAVVGVVSAIFVHWLLKRSREGIYGSAVAPLA